MCRICVGTSLYYKIYTTKGYGFNGCIKPEDRFFIQIYSKDWRRPMDLSKFQYEVG